VLLLQSTKIQRLEALIYFTKLQILNVSSCNIKNYELKHVGKLQNLKKLQLNYIQSINSDGIVHLTTLRKLNDLEMISCFKVTDSAIPVLENLANLRNFDFGSFCYRSISDHAIERLEESITRRIVGVNCKNIDKYTVDILTYLKTKLDI